MSTQVHDSDDSTDTEPTSSIIDGVDNAGFEAIVEADILDAFLESAIVVVNEARIHLDPDGLAMTAVDAANVGMVDSFLSERAFEHYETSEGVIGVDLGRLQDVVSFGDAGDLVRLALNEETRKLHIEIDGLEYTLALIDPDSIRKEPEIPDLDFAGQVAVEAPELDLAVTAADMVADHIALGIDEAAETFVVDANGDQDDVHLELGEEDLLAITPGEARSLYSLDYVDDMVGAIPSDEGVRLELGVEVPTKLHYSTAESDVEVTYMLAPRIQSN